jgi:hypothetical protein
MEQNRDVKESPDRWHRRLLNAARPHGRFAVISSSATAGVLLVLGGIVFANQGTDEPRGLGAPPASVVSSTASGAEAPSAVPSATTTSTVPVAGSDVQATTVPENDAQGTLPTNTTVAGTPPTSAAPGPTTSSTVSSTTSPSTVANATTTTTSRIRTTNGPLIPNLEVDLTSYADDPELRLKIASEDKDGYITRVVINWGDQSNWEVWSNPTVCTEPLSSVFAPPTVSHKYTDMNTYTVTVTVSSTNCKGEGEQQSMFTRQVTVGGSVATTAPTTTTVP